MKTISSEVICDTGIFVVTRDHALDPDGFEIRRSIVQHPGSAVIMPVNARKHVLLVRQYRLPAKRMMWELPAGKIDPGETALRAAKRELKEETGCKARNWSKLAEFYPSPGFLAEKMSIFLARDLTEGEATPMDDERIEKKWHSARELDSMIRSGAIIDAKTTIGFLRWKRYG